MRLNEIIGYYNLTDNQKKVLVACAVSGTPQQAFEFTIGNSGLVSARNTLVNIGLLNVQGNQMAVTDKGRDALTNYNLIDQSGQLTPDATDLLKGSEDTTGSQAEESQDVSASQ